MNAWGIVNDDFPSVATEYFGGSPLNTALDATNIVLISKVEYSNSLAKYRPISLCPVVYKVLSKIMVARMGLLLHKLFSREQSTFIKGRSILDNILIAQELVQYIHKKVRGGNILMKIDMDKAYDRVNWHVLLAVVKRLSFSDHWRNLIYNCISSPL